MSKTKRPAATRAKKSAEPERRRAPRRQPAVGTICRLSAGKKTRLGLVWNLSESGLSMLVSEELTAGAELKGNMTTLDEAASIPITFHVTHVKKLLTGDFLVGGPFEHALSATQMSPFVGVAS